MDNAPQDWRPSLATTVARSQLDDTWVCVDAAHVLSIHDAGVNGTLAAPVDDSGSEPSVDVAELLGIPLRRGPGSRRVLRIRTERSTFCLVLGTVVRLVALDLHQQHVLPAFVRGVGAAACVSSLVHHGDRYEFMLDIDQIAKTFVRGAPGSRIAGLNAEQP